MAVIAAMDQAMLALKAAEMYEARANLQVAPPRGLPSAYAGLPVVLL